MIDPILEPWAKFYNLHIYKRYKDTDVRSIDVVSPKGKRFQLWLDIQENDSNPTVHVWDYDKRKKKFFANEENLQEILEEAYKMIQSWFTTVID
ncbi:MAG: hypothetical protein COB30_000440 [Ectothiorhodospiraceae bacterium]|nr:hypothetical protein [Ectothiorhodospiraceae bacterium]